MGKLLLSRRDIVTLATTAAAASVTPGAFSRSESGSHSRGGAVPTPLRRFIADYMRIMNAPGLTLGLATRESDVATAAYGYVDVAARTPASPDQLFQIGSITKSFAGLVILQLQDEGKLDVDQSILHHLPWLPIETDYGDISIHHLLTHTSGMPNQAPVFAAEAGWRLRQGIAPGSQFHYSNWGYNVLGRLIEAIDGCSWPAAVTRRLLLPLGMTDSVAAISSSTRPRIAASYTPLHDDRPYPRRGVLVPAGNLTFTTASGSIASTPRDMIRYMQMLLNRGVGPRGRVLSEEGFALFATGHIDAPDFGPGARYGYGLAVDQLDGHTRLRHSGGMPSFMSSIQLDMDAGVAAFASINAYQGYRPNAVVSYALQLLRSRTDGHVVATPPADEWAAVENPDAYAGVYSSPDGGRLEVTVEGDQLVLWSNAERIALQPVGGDEFLADHPRFRFFPLSFGRGSTSSQGAVGRPAPEIVEVSYGPDWYAHARFHSGPAALAPTDAAACAGVFRPDDDVAIGIARVVLRRGCLWLDGTVPLEPIGGRRYRVATAPGTTEVLEFRCVVDGRAEILMMSGQVLRRIPTEA